MNTPARQPLPFARRETDPIPVSGAVAVWGRYPAMRAGIRTLLAEVGVDAVDAPPGNAPQNAPGVLIADAGDGSLDDVLVDLREQFPGAALILLAGDASAFESISGEAAPAGMLLRDVTGPELASAVGAVSNGLSVADPQVMARLGRHTAGRRTDLEPLEEHLTERELEVLAQLALGIPNKAIALRLGISEHTVKYHVGEILGKLGAASRTEAVMQGARRGLLSL